MMVTFVLEEDLAAGDTLARHDADVVPLTDDVIEIKGVDYVVRSRRWKSGWSGLSVTVTVRAVLEVPA